MLFEKENTEEKIIRATFDILQREGLQKTTTKKIAAEAGVNEVTIFRKFENKKNLLVATKDFYMKNLLDKLETAFEYDEDEIIEDYLKNAFYGMLNLTQEDFSIIKVAMQEVKDEPYKKMLISEITDLVLNQMEVFFKKQIEKGEIRDINPRAIAILSFGVVFESIILWQIYGDQENHEQYDYSDDFMDIIFNGIKS